VSKGKFLPSDGELMTSDLMVRFVYEHDIKGEWVNAHTAWQNGFMVSDENYRVIRLDFERRERPPRVRVK
jgi:hypothetical protein